MSTPERNESETKPRTRRASHARDDDEQAPERQRPTALTDVIPTRELAPGLEHNTDPNPPFAVA